MRRFIWNLIKLYYYLYSFQFNQLDLCLLIFLTFPEPWKSSHRVISGDNVEDSDSVGNVEDHMDGIMKFSLYSDAKTFCEEHTCLWILHHAHVYEGNLLSFYEGSSETYCKSALEHMRKALRDKNTFQGRTHLA
jgi:hypothetical protein